MTLVQRLLLLVGTVLAILVAAWVYGTVSLREAHDRTVRNDLQHTLALVSWEYESFVERAQHVVATASFEAPHAVASTTACQALVGALQASGLRWLRLDVLDGRGIVRCSTEQENVGSDMSRYPEVISAPADGHTLVGDYAWGLFSGAPGLVMVRRWRSPEGTSGVVAAVARIDPLLSSLPKMVRSGYSFILADRGGRVLATGPGHPGAIGHPLPESLALLSRLPASGYAVTQWSDGSERLVAYTPPDTARNQGVFVALAVTNGSAETGTLGLAYAPGVGFLIAAIAAFLLAWWGGIHFIRRPLGELARVALRWKDGDEAARVTLPGRSEIAELGRVFNDMADAKDLSDRQKRESAELLTALIDSSRDSIFVADRDGHLLMANTTFQELADTTDKPPLVPTAQGVAHGPRVEPALDELRRTVVVTRLPQAADVLAQAVNQGRRVLQTICTPIFDVHGTVRAVAGIGRDVTEARSAAETLREARDKAEAADRAKTRFLAAASHDLRQPLQAAIMLADLVAEKAGSSTHTVTLAESLRHNLGDMKRLLDSLFDLSRLDFAAVPPDLAVFPLQPLLDQITMAYRRSSESKGIDLIVGRTDAVIRSDRVLLARMLSNLIENGVRYTEVGNVTIRCQAAGNALRIRVEDTGIGISQQDLSRIWQEFEQLHNPERDRRQGLGLGLSIVRRLATLLDHPVEVHSEPSKGSCFVVTVPMVEGAVATTNASIGVSKSIETNVAALNGEGRLVVVIDDDPMVLDVLRLTLEERGWDVIAAADCEDASHEVGFAGRIPDLIIADYRLRGGQVGTDAIAAIRGVVGHQVPAFILTGELAGASDEGDRPLEDAKRVGAGMFRKPIGAHELERAIRLVMAEPMV